MACKYFWLEYCDYIKERLNSIEREIKSLLINLQHLSLRREAFVYYDELKSLLEFIGKSYKNLSKDECTEAWIIPELRYLFAGAELRIEVFQDLVKEYNEHSRLEDIKDIKEKYTEIENLFERLEQALAQLKYGIDQLSSGEFLKQTIFYQYSFTSSLTDVPSQEKILCAVSSVVHNYSELIFGEEWIKKYKIRPIAIAGFGDYAIYPHIFIAHYPIADTFRTRFWTSFGHEVQHEKNYITTILWKKLKYVKTKKYVEMLNNRIELLFNNNFKNWLALHSNLSQSLRERQLDEIISDISNVLLSGPSDFLSLLSAHVGGIFFIDNHIRGHHPPLFLRFEYSLKVVKEVLKLGNFIKEYSEIIKPLEEEFKKYLEFLEICNLYDIYSAFREYIINNFNKIVKLTKFSITSYLVNKEDIFFNSKRYKQAIEVKENLLEGKSIEETCRELEGDTYEIEPRVILMAGWLKRLDEFKNLDTSFDILNKYNEIKRRFYPNIINYLYHYYENLRRG